jgi:DeoR/GlpR family transcriptional regulator of sugar metabolism
MRVPQHLVDRRREELRGLVRRDGFLPVAEICRRLGVSEATARRDLVAIEAGGHVTRTHGGALADYNTAFASLGERAVRARGAKGRIAALAAERLPKTGIVFLDAGTTVQALARLLVRRKHLAGLTVITNSLSVATMLGGAKGIDLHVLGGTFLHRQAVLFGPETIESLARWKFDAAFLGGEGMDAEGITNSHPEIAEFQQAVIARSERTFFCLDSSKLNRATPHRVTAWRNAVSLITDATPAQLLAAGLKPQKARAVSG